MSASAEVHIAVSRPFDDDAVSKIVEDHLCDIGMSDWEVARLQSGALWDGKGHSVSWDVFEQSWADGLVKAIYEVAPEADTEVYVYNLEREADVVSRTSMVKEVAV